jgi:signal transduction histidine kinase
MKELLQRYGVTDIKLTKFPVDRFPSLFRSARLKLTIFYLATLLAFSLTLTIGIRMFAEYEMNRAYAAQQGEFRELARNGLDLLVANPEKTFRNAQDHHASIARQHLNRDLVLLNLGALILGGLVSYWFAGRTLKPIAATHEAQARFVADASHELRTPLANIRAENEVFLRQKDFSAKEMRELVQSNLEEVQRLENLSRDLLALTQYGQTELPKTAQQVEAIVQEAVSQTKKAQEQRSVRVETMLEATEISVNHESLVRLFVILLDNAIKYGSEKGVVYIAGARRGSQYVVTVRDEGKGIASKDLPYIFDRLYRGDTSRTSVGSKTAGYGLGLALATEITQANQGSIRAYNAEQGGAVFSVQLPLARNNKA